MTNNQADLLKKIVEQKIITKEKAQSIAMQAANEKDTVENILTKLHILNPQDMLKIVVDEKDLDKSMDNKDVNDSPENAPVTKVVSVIIRHAVEGGASDIHIEPLTKETRVRYRIDGILHTTLTLPKNIHYAVVARIKVLAGLKLDETRVPQEGRIRMVIGDKEIDFRISIIPLVDEEKIVMRILDVTKGAPSLSDLGFEDHELRVILRASQKTHGIFLVTGPTGSGKSTTLFSILNILNKEGVNISTLEDPVEYYIQGISQSQIRPSLGFTFASGLRVLLRQDPDIMMVGEVRDNETAELAIHAALTGHLVLSTLHTNNAIGVIPRMLDMHVEPFLLASTLNGIVAQRLVRKICQKCKTQEELPESVLESVKKQLAELKTHVFEKRIKDVKIDLDKLVFYKGSGCSSCANTGYSGRIVISEALEITQDLRNIIMTDPKQLTEDFIRKKQNFISLSQEGLIKALKGLTTVEEVMRVMNS